VNLPLKVFVREQRDEGDRDCPDFETGTSRGRNWQTCDSDGHYRCIECKWLDPDSEYALTRPSQPPAQKEQPK
jgi:hypothetical protein